MSEENPTTEKKVVKTRRRKSVPAPPETAGEDDLKPIHTQRGLGPRLGITTYYEGDKDVAFSFRDKRTGEVYPLASPVAVRATREGGDNYRIELFFTPQTNEIPMERFDGKNFLVVYGVNPETEKKKGKLFQGLVCSAKTRTTLDRIGEIKLTKYTCLTQPIDWFGETPRHLNGLGAPYDKH